MKAARRAEIERRASELKPPIPAHILPLIPSFKAGIQITSSFNDTAWNLLKPRLIAQMKDVDQKLHQKQETYSNSPATPEQNPQRLTLEKNSKLIKPGMASNILYCCHFPRCCQGLCLGISLHIHILP